jgi:cytochrome c
MKFLNQIIAAILLTFVVIFIINKSSDVIYRVEAPKTVFEVNEKDVSQTSESKPAEGTVDIKALLAMGSIEHGKKIFSTCKACHSIKESGGNKIGPALWGVLGRPIGSINDYKYSKAFAEFGGEWNLETMNSFLIKPKDYIKGTKMIYAGLKKEKDRASVILYLNENTDNPLQLP